MFPSPNGELHFSIEIKGTERTDSRHRFRPLTGSYISQWVDKTFYASNFNSFRPLTGSYISQLCYIYHNSFGGGGFRPLTGSYISQSIQTWRSIRRSKFPSPNGELHFSIIVDFEIIEQTEDIVSVP